MKYYLYLLEFDLQNLNKQALSLLYLTIKLHVFTVLI